MPEQKVLIETFDDVEGIMHIVQEEEAPAVKPKGVLALISGNALKTDIVNKNRRLYKREVMSKAVDKAQPKLEARKLLGELDHPDGFLQNPAGSLARAAIKFTDLWIEGNLVKYKGHILDVAEGRKLYELLEAGVGAGVSTRGRAFSHPDKIEGVEVDVIDDFDFFGIDVVLNPANPAAEGFQYEGEQIDFNNEAFKDSFNGEDEKMAITNVEELVAAYPELVESIKAQAIADAKEGIENSVKEALKVENETAVNELKATFEAEKTQAIEAAKAEVLASEEIQNLQTLKKVVGEAVAEFNAKAEKKEEDSKVEEISAKLTEAETARDDFKAKYEAEKLAKELVVTKDSLLKDYPHASLMRERIENCGTIEDMKAVFEKEKVFIESIILKASANGTGKQNSAEPKTADLAEQEKIRQRKLAGIGK